MDLNGNGTDPGEPIKMGFGERSDVLADQASNRRERRRALARESTGRFWEGDCGDEEETGRRTAPLPAGCLFWAHSFFPLGRR